MNPERYQQLIAKAQEASAAKASEQHDEDEATPPSPATGTDGEENKKASTGNTREQSSFTAEYNASTGHMAPSASGQQPQTQSSPNSKNTVATNNTRSLSSSAPPTKRPVLAQVVGKWASSMRRAPASERIDVNRVSKSVVEYLEAEAIEVVSNTPNGTPNGRRFILVGAALAFAVVTIGSTVWLSLRPSQQSTMRPTLPTEDPTANPSSLPTSDQPTEDTMASQTLRPSLRSTPQPTEDPTANPSSLPTSAQISCGMLYREDTTEQEKITVRSCGSVGKETTRRGKKYFFEGNGDFVTLSTCNAYTKGAEAFNFYDSRIRVFESNTENNEEKCVAANDNDAACNHKASTVRFRSAPNVLYVVYIDGPLEEGGRFELETSCQSVRPDSLHFDEILNRRGYILSSNGAFMLTLQSDGHLLMKGHNGNGGVYWSARWPSNGTFRGTLLKMQRDGNLVLRDATGQMVWSSDTLNRGCIMTKILDTGKLVLLDRFGKVCAEFN